MGRVEWGVLLGVDILLTVLTVWLLAHPDLVELPAVRAVLGFVTDCARADRIRLRG